MIRRARSTETTDPFAPLRRAPSPRRYYDLGQSSIVEWQSGVDDHDDGAARRFYTLRDLELRLEQRDGGSACPCSSFIVAAADPRSWRACSRSIRPTACSSSRRRCASSSTATACDSPSPETRRDLRVLLQSYGLEPNGGERRLIFKLNSLAVHSLVAIRAACQRSPSSTCCAIPRRSSRPSPARRPRFFAPTIARLWPR